MRSLKKSLCSKKTVVGIFIVAVFLLAQISISQAVPIPTGPTWWPLPPYNTLWPLWSDVLSPPNALGINVPIVSSLTKSTVLPVQPGLTWDPVNQTYPWLLYNTPSGMVYYDPVFGIDLWPPPYLQNVLGAPLPLDLTAVLWSTLAPTSTTWLSTNIPVGNNAYYTSYPQFAPLLDPATILGLTLI